MLFMRKENSSSESNEMQVIVEHMTLQNACTCIIDPQPTGKKESMNVLFLP